MKVYLAGSWSARDDLRLASESLTKSGIFVTSRWLHQSGGDIDPLDSPGPAISAALNDLEDIESSDIFLLYTGRESTTGGFHVELGYALARAKPILIAGNAVNIFARLATVLVPSLGNAIEIIRYWDNNDSVIANDEEGRTYFVKLVDKENHEDNGSTVKTEEN